MTHMMTALATIFALGSAPVPAFLTVAAPAPQVAAPALSPAPADRSALLKELATSLSSVATAQGNFEQMAPDGSYAAGTFAISRPGKVRFDYDDPTPILIVSDGATVAIQDSDLETTDRVPLGTTPLSLLLDDSLDFETEADVTNIMQVDGLVALTLTDKDGEMDGTLTLLFKDDDKSLLGWRTEDSNGGITSVQLQNVETGKRLNPRLFILDDFEDEDE